MTNQEKKATLERYRVSGRELRRLEEELLRWEALATRVTATARELPGGGKDGDRVQEAVERMALLREELALEAGRLAELRQEVEAAIRTVGNPRLEELLRCRYVRGWTWERIAAEMHTDSRWLQRLHSRALERLTVESHP